MLFQNPVLNLTVKRSLANIYLLRRTSSVTPGQQAIDPLKDLWALELRKSVPPTPIITRLYWFGQGTLGDGCHLARNIRNGKETYPKRWTLECCQGVIWVLVIKSEDDRPSNWGGRKPVRELVGFRNKLAWFIFRIDSPNYHSTTGSPSERKMKVVGPGKVFDSLKSISTNYFLVSGHLNGGLGFDDQPELCVALCRRFLGGWHQEHIMPFPGRIALLPNQSTHQNRHQVKWGLGRDCPTHGILEIHERQGHGYPASMFLRQLTCPDL